MSRRLSLWALLLAVVLLASGCLRWTTAQIEVAGKAPVNVLVVMHRSPTNQVEGLHDAFNAGDAKRSLAMMGDWVWSAAAKQRITRVGLAFSDFDHFFEPDQAADFASAIRDSRGNSRCLAMDRSWGSFTDDRHNWTSRSASDTHCLIGRPFALA